jgi:hypothetical protein
LFSSTTTTMWSKRGTRVAGGLGPTAVADCGLDVLARELTEGGLTEAEVEVEFEFEFEFEVTVEVEVAVDLVLTDDPPPQAPTSTAAAMIATAARTRSGPGMPPVSGVPGVGRAGGNVAG